MLGILSASLLTLLSVTHPETSKFEVRSSNFQVTVRDRPNDGGGTLAVTWQPAEGIEVAGYEVWRQAESDTWVRAGFRGPRAVLFEDNEVTDRRQYRYRVAAVTDAGDVFSEPSAWARSSAQWFDFERLPAMVGTAFFTILIVWFIEHARRNRSLFIRRIAGLDAVEEALGRSTEMGRAILYVPGLSTISDVATIASLNILGEVAKKTAHFGAPLTVPVADPIVYTVAREVVRESYTTAGRPDAFNPDSVFFMTDNQFAFAAGVSGVMARERPATNFFVGMFWAESLILAETGATTGAIQIAGTDAVNQLPFFITACDYTLIGEELYAASAYLSREPLLLGSLVGQDFAKLSLVVLLVVATLASVVTGFDATGLL